MVEILEYYSDVFEEALEYGREGKIVISERCMGSTDEGIDISNSMALFV